LTSSDPPAAPASWSVKGETSPGGGNECECQNEGFLHDQSLLEAIDVVAMGSAPDVERSRGSVRMRLPVLAEFVLVPGMHGARQVDHRDMTKMKACSVP